MQVAHLTWSLIQLSCDITSLVHFVELKGNRFGHAIYHPSFTA